MVNPLAKEADYRRHPEIDSSLPDIKVIKVKSKQDLTDLLDENGIDYSDWGNRNSSSKNPKNIDTLWKDLQNKDTWLAYVDGTLTRLVIPLNVQLFHTNASGQRFKLIEAFQAHYDEKGEIDPDKFRERKLECVSEKLREIELHSAGIYQPTPELFEKACDSESNFYERVTRRATEEELRQYDENDEEVYQPLGLESAEFLGISVLDSNSGFSYPTLPALYLAVGVKAELDPNLAIPNTKHSDDLTYAYAEINFDPNTGHRRRITAFEWVPVDANDEIIRDENSENLEGSDHSQLR